MPDNNPIIERNGDRVVKQDLALALTLPDDATPIGRPVTRMRWTPAFLAALWAIKAATRVARQAPRHLPLAALRMALEIDCPELLNHDGQVGLGLYYPPAPDRAPPPFAGFTPSPDLAPRLTRVVSDWAGQALDRYIDHNGLPENLHTALDPLFDQDTLFTLETTTPILFPWRANDAGNSEAPSDGFVIGPHEIAQQLVGHELFPGLGPVHRVIKRDGRSTDLISPLIVARDGGRFHLVCALELKTLPGYRQPLLQINLHKRIWSQGLKDGYTSHEGTSGYLLDHRYSPPRAFSFGVVKDRQGWRLDDDYAVLAKRFPELPLPATPQQIIDLPGTDSCTVFIARHNAVEGRHDLELDAGVPERDKIDCFERVRNALAPLGFTPFTDFDTRRCSQPKSADLRMNAAVFLSELMPAGTPRADSDQPETTDLDQRVSELTGRSLAQWRSNNPLIDLDDKAVTGLGKRLDGYRNLTDLSRALLQMSLDQTRRKHWDLYLITDDRRSQELLAHIVHSLFGEQIRCHQLILPRDAHGARAALPGKDESKSKRHARRCAVWRDLLASLGPLDQPLCLVQAAAWYPGQQHDDTINKIAARHALAADAGAVVQYLLPPELREKLDRQSKLWLGKRDDARALYQKFCTELLDELQQRQPGALVFIDSTHGAGLWSWLSDKGYARDTRWPSLRIVRVRDQAPQLMQHKTTGFHKVEDGSPIAISHVTTVPRLFRIGAGRAEVYWGLAKPQGNYKRGESCYRTVDLADTGKDKESGQRLTRLVPHAPVIKRQATPNAVEFTVLGRQDSDDPDAIACCAAQLRNGSIQARTETALRHPLPLAVVAILKEYM